MSNSLVHVTYRLSGLHCGSCVQRVSTALAPYAQHIAVTLDPMQVVLTEPNAGLAQLQSALSTVGQYTINPVSSPPATPIITPTRPQMTAADAHRDTLTSWLNTYKPLLLIFAFISAGSVLLQISVGFTPTVEDTMRLFMAGFFIVFAFFKLLDLRAFAQAYAGYDLLAMRWQGWGYVYPFVELSIGVLYLINRLPVFTAWTTLLVMGFSAIGVIRAVTRKQQIRCACLGTVFNLPMSTVTIIEDVGMVLMAAWMLYMHAV